MSAKKPKHHQVPRMLMRPWANPEGKVKWRHKIEGQWRPRSPESIMLRKGAYSLPLSGDREAAEKALSQLEGAANQVIRDLLKALERSGAGTEEPSARNLGSNRRGNTARVHSMSVQPIGVRPKEPNGRENG